MGQNRTGPKCPKIKTGQNRTGPKCPNLKMEQNRTGPKCTKRGKLENEYFKKDK